MKKFTKNNETFICIKCGKDVELHPSSSRDHCNHCLTGLHVDINPGDRLNECKAELVPIEIDIRNGKEKIVYKCKKCSATIKNITAPDDDRDEINKLFNIR